MYSFLSRYGQFIALGLGVFITIVFFAIVGANGSTFSSLAEQNLSLKDYNAELSKTGIFNFGLVCTGLLILAAAAAVAVFGVLGIVTDFKSSMKGLIGLGILLAIFIILYFISSSSGDSAGVLEVINKINASTYDAVTGEATINTVTPGKSSYISASLITTILLGGVALVSMIGFELWNMFR